MRRRTGLIFITLLALAFFGAWALAGHPRVEYRTEPVEHGDMNVTVSATGNPNAVVTVQVGSQVSGTILALFADFNTKVTNGQLIARIDPAPFQAKVDQAQANLDAARASVANAQAVVQQAMANIQSANSSLAAAQANVAKARAVAEDAKVKVDRRIVMVSQGADAQEDLETAETSYKSAMADQNALVEQEHAVADGVNRSSSPLLLCNRPSLTWITPASRRLWTASLSREMWTSDRLWLQASRLLLFFSSHRT
jgi:HlyD family secretion protein